MTKTPEQMPLAFEEQVPRSLGQGLPSNVVVVNFGSKVNKASDKPQTATEKKILNQVLEKASKLSW